MAQVGNLTAGAGVGSRSFRRLLTSWAFSSVGDGVRVAALPLYTAVSTRDPVSVSAVAAAEVLPWLLVALPAGALIDRWDARRCALLAHAFRFVVTCTVAVAIATGTDRLVVLVAGAFLLASAETFADSACQSMLVRFAGRVDLERANSRFVAIETAGMEIAGPLAAAALFAWEPAAAFATMGLAFAVAAAWLAAAPSPRLLDRATTRTALYGELLAGIRYLLREPGLRALVGIVAVVAVLVSAVNAIAVLFAIEVLDMPAAVVPTLLVSMAAGTILASQLVPRSAARIGAGRTMGGALLLLAGGIALLGLSGLPRVGCVLDLGDFLGGGHLPATAWVSYFVMGLGAGGWNVLSATKRQQLTPEPLMGRVTSAHRVVAWGLMPLGAALAGPLGELTSLAAVLLTAALSVGIMALPAAHRLHTRL